MNEITTLKKSLLMIQKLKKLLQEQKDKLYEPIAIIGMSCRVPQANNLNEFWQLLCQGKNVITSIPDERWTLLKDTDEIAQRDTHLNYWGGYLNSIEEFDAYFFGISPREAMRMDPQQRMLLEVSYESLEDAGLTVDTLAGSNMGVFSSLYASQFSHMQSLDSAMDALFIPTGSAISIAANRLSYLFDLHGPSMALDTACSSSLIAVHLACLNLQAKLCDTALVNAVNINLLPSIHKVLAEATMLSPTGQCHTFDSKADGYTQGEGAGAIILKPLSRALKDKDKIYAVIAGSAVNQDGKTNGLTAPNGLQQEQLLRSAYQAARVNPDSVSYIECHGTGTFLGDPIEIQALGEVIGKSRPKERPCWIGSIKTNIGHLEPAAGIVGLIKTSLILKNGLIPPHLNFTTANPHIAFERYGLRIPSQNTAQLPQYDGGAFAGVSGFGFGGANAHIVLKEYVAEESEFFTPNITRDKELFTLSAKDTSALSELVNRWCTYLEQNEEISLAQICYNLHLKRSHYSYRLAIIADSKEDLYRKLSENQDIFRSSEAKKTLSSTKIEQFENIDLSTLAEHYVNHATINWHKYEEGRFYPPIALPLYPWQRKKYWPALTRSTINTTQTNYPLRGRVLASPLSLCQLEFTIDIKEVPEFKDTFFVVHAGYYLDMLAYAVRQLDQTTSFHISNFDYLLPLFASNEKPIAVQLIIEKSEEHLAFCFYSSDGKGHWTKHATGMLALQTPPRINLDEKSTIINRSLKEGTAESFRQRVQSMKMPSENTISWTDHYWHGNHELFCELRNPIKSERIEQFVMNMHPGVIDACIQTVFLLLPEELRKPYIASHMSEITFYGIPDEPRYIYTTLKKIESDGKKVISDWYLLDKNYNLITACHNLCLSQLNENLQIDKLLEQKNIFHLDSSLPYQTNKNRLINYLVEQIAIIFSMPESDINIHHSLHELGMDSLMAATLTQIIEKNTGTTYSLALMMQGPSINELAEQILAIDFKPEKTESMWIANRKIQTKAQFRLFCFPYGGGGASIYREWQREFPDSIEICPIQLPGRENRLEEHPLDNLNVLVAELAQHLKPLFDLPFAFFGHSFGSLIGFELTRYLRRHRLPQPIHLFTSAYPDPRKPSKSLDNLLASLKHLDINLFDLNQERIAQLDEGILNTLSFVFKDNGIVDYSDDRMNKNIIKILLPIFIGDMKIVKNYSYYHELPLETPITVFQGKQDLWVAPADHKGWINHSSTSCVFHEFDSGHLFVREKNIRAKIIQEIKEKLLSFAYEDVAL